MTTLLFTERTSVRFQLLGFTVVEKDDVKNELER
jgi:hypothetical protein